MTDAATNLARSSTTAHSPATLTDATSVAKDIRQRITTYCAPEKTTIKTTVHVTASHAALIVTVMGTMPLI
jgi:hypothetical protein